MRSFNRVMFIGHLAADPEVRQTKNGHTVATFPLATSKTVLDESGEKKEFTDFHRVVAWSKLAEVCGQYLIKGMAVFLQGRLVNRSFDDKEGNRHFRTEVSLEDLIILTWKKNKSGENQIELQNLVDENEDDKVTEKAVEPVLV